MLQPTIVTKTKDYVLLKIPRTLWMEKDTQKDALAEEKKMVMEGLKAAKERRVSKTFNSAKSAIAYLRSL